MNAVEYTVCDEVYYTRPAQGLARLDRILMPLFSLVVLTWPARTFCHAVALVLAWSPVKAASIGAKMVNPRAFVTFKLAKVFNALVLFKAVV